MHSGAVFAVLCLRIPVPVLCLLCMRAVKSEVCYAFRCCVCCAVPRQGPKDALCTPMAGQAAVLAVPVLEPFDVQVPVLRHPVRGKLCKHLRGLCSILVRQDGRGVAQRPRGQAHVILRLGDPTVPEDLCALRRCAVGREVAHKKL